jgi:GNAT superfamily N-acetyltransferase
MADAVHVDFYERPAVLAERLHLAPTGCHLLERAGRALGYVLSHPWRDGHLPPLDTLLTALPATPDTWYIHDLCLLPEARGTGSAAEIVAHLQAVARAAGLPTLSLVAVNGSVPFWQRQGFVVLDRPGLTQKLLSYEPEARYMAQALIGAEDLK